jgi:beta-galactosidase
MAGTAVTPFQIEDDVNLIPEMGSNAVRVADGQHSDYFYTLCDEAGIIVWSDMPLVGATYMTDFEYVDTERFKANGEEQLSEMICQLYNHPSVALWGLFSNFSTRGDDPCPYIRHLDSLARRLDPNRFTVAASNQDGRINFITDLIVFNQSFGWLNGMPDDIVVWMEQMRRDWSKLHAGVSYAAGGSIYLQSEDLTKTKVESNQHPENWQTYFHERYVVNLAGNTQFWGIFVGNMFDFGAAQRIWGDGKGVNDYGLVTFDRKDRKDAYYLYKANWNDTEPFVYITGKRLDTRTVRRQTVKVYSNQPEIELFVNNRSAGKRRGTNGIFTWENVDFKGGINRIEARSDLATDRTAINIDMSGGVPRQGELTGKRADQ